MGNISTEQKLQLAQMIRAESQDNRMKMRSRERMLYGTGGKFEDDDAASKELPLYVKGYFDGYKNDTKKEMYAAQAGNEIPAAGGGSFRFRLVLAVCAFAAFLLWDAGGTAIAGITAAQIREEMNKDFTVGTDSIVFDFRNNFPYTLFDSSQDG